MTNKVIRQISKCAENLAEKSKYLKQKSDEKLIGTRLILNFSFMKYKPL